MIKLNCKSIPQNEWMTKGLLRSCNKRSLLYKKFKRGGKMQDKENYIKYRNKLKSIIKKAQKTFYHDQFKSFSGNLKQTWKLLGKIVKNQSPKEAINSLSSNGIKICDKKEIANQLNEYFVNIGSQLAALIPTSTINFSSYLKQNYMNSICLLPRDSNEIINIVLNFKNKISSGYDGIPTNIMKIAIHPVAETISLIINSSLDTGIFPDLLKVAKVCPIFKTVSGINFKITDQYLSCQVFLKLLKK